MNQTKEISQNRTTENKYKNWIEKTKKLRISWYNSLKNWKSRPYEKENN